MNALTMAFAAPYINAPTTALALTMALAGVDGPDDLQDEPRAQSSEETRRSRPENAHAGGERGRASG